MDRFKNRDGGMKSGFLRFPRARAPQCSQKGNQMIDSREYGWDGKVCH